MSGNEDFHDRYAAALRNYLDSPDDANLSIGNELGRTALQNQISLLEIVENHVRLVFEIAKDVRIDGPIALEFLLQLLAPSTWPCADSSTATGATRNSGIARIGWQIATNSATRW